VRRSVAPDRTSRAGAPRIVVLGQVRDPWLRSCFLEVLESAGFAGPAPWSESRTWPWRRCGLGPSTKRARPPHGRPARMFAGHGGRGVSHRSCPCFVEPVGERASRPRRHRRPRLLVEGIDRVSGVDGTAVASAVEVGAPVLKLHPPDKHAVSDEDLTQPLSGLRSGCRRCLRHLSAGVPRVAERQLSRPRQSTWPPRWHRDQGADDAQVRRAVQAPIR
jgi:hypothetical protein